MSTFSNPASSDTLNAYVDGTLTAAERARIESAVAENPALGQELLELQATAILLGSLPELKPRRSFRLGEEYARPTDNAQPANVSAIVRLLPVMRTLSVAAALIFMVVVGAFFFDVNGGSDSNPQQTLQQQNVIMGVTDSSSGASEQAEDASDTDNSSTLVERGDSASASDQPTDDLTAMAPSADESAGGSTAQDSGTFGATVTDDQDSTVWIIASVVFGGLVVVFGGAWYALAQGNRPSGTR